jgi:hypothetical protein
MSTSLASEYPYDVAISFAGEDRAIAQQLVELLKARGINVFYDINEQVNLWGKDLIEHLTDVYSNKARYCLMLISKYYPVKPWTQLERRSAQVRALRQPEEYILPVRLDDTEIPGLLSTIGYIDLRHRSVVEVADQVVQKLGRHVSQPQEKTEAIPIASATKYNIPIPQVATRFTQLDKDRFIEGAFVVMKEYFQQALSELKNNYPGTDTDLREINTVKFVARIYVQGQLKCMCKIWLGNSFGPESIQYSEGSQINIDQDNSFNDSISVDQTPSGLGLKLSPISL